LISTVICSLVFMFNCIYLLMIRFSFPIELSLIGLWCDNGMIHTLPPS
jgi:hypothetical protein